MWQVVRPRISPWQGARFVSRRYASGQPPAPRPWKQTPPEERISRHPAHPEEPQPERKKGFISRLWPFSSTQPSASTNEPKDPKRGLEATIRVVREGVLDPRYKDAAKKYTRLICALPIAIYTSYELYRRRFLGVQQKKVPAVKGTTEAEPAGRKQSRS